MADKFIVIWEWVQDRLDISGDAIMCLYTAAIVYKMLHGGLGYGDAAAYGSAVAAFGYSNRNKGGPHSV